MKRFAPVPLLLVAALSSQCAPRHVTGPGDHVRIRSTEGDQLEGKLVAIDRDSVRIDARERGTVAIGRENVERVEIRRRHRGWLRAVNGLLAGANGILFFRFMADHEGSWRADHILIAGYHVYMTAELTRGAAQDSLWRRARLPEPTRGR